jgi:hypothetical protein
VVLARGSQSRLPRSPPAAVLSALRCDGLVGRRLRDLARVRCDRVGCRAQAVWDVEGEPAPLCDTHTRAVLVESPRRAVKILSVPIEPLAPLTPVPPVRQEALL